jgi:thioredoxin reductase (NADPH)
VLAGHVPGGLLLAIERIEGMPGFPEGVPGYDLCPMTQEQAEAAGAAFATAQVDALEPQADEWGVRAGGERYRTGAVIFATGARMRALSVPGEERLFGKGVSHCASCDGPMLRNQTVVVVGSGDSAMQEALHLTAFAQRVIMLHRGRALAGQASYRDRVLANDKIEHRYGTLVSEILGDAAVTGVRVRDAQSGAVAHIETAAVFAYVGLEPNSGVLRGLAELDAGGRVMTDHCLRTSRPGLLAAGIVRAGSAGQAAAAAGDGVAAALAAHRFLLEKAK